MLILSDLSKRVCFNYFVKRKLEVGIVLFGWEVKCIRLNGIDITKSFVLIKHGIVFLIDSFISSSNFVFKHFDFNENRDRLLLLNKNEAYSSIGFLKIQGHTIIPSKVYWKRSFLKVELSYCVGKKLYDKRLQDKNKEYIKEINSFLKE